MAEIHRPLTTRDAFRSPPHRAPERHVPIDNAERRRIFADLAVMPLIDLAGEAERLVAFLRRLVSEAGPRADPRY